jgi:hypothetical protein
MRVARKQCGMAVDGDSIVAYRSPNSIRKSEDEALSFCEWDVGQPLPDYQDHVTGDKLLAPPFSKSDSGAFKGSFSHFIHPNNPKFGPPSVVKVPRASKDTKLYLNVGTICANEIEDDVSPQCTNNVTGERMNQRSKENGFKVDGKKQIPGKRRPVKDRWYYEPVEEPQPNTTNLTMAAKVEPDVTTNLIDASLEDGIMDSMLCCPPPDLGALDLVSQEDIDGVTHDENGARALQGVVFYDCELEWCRITGWGVECGVVILFYVPVNSPDLTLEEQFAPIDELISIIKMSPTSSVLPRLEASRKLKGPIGQRKMFCYRRLPHAPLSVSLGSSVIRTIGEKVGSYNGKVLTSKIICRILRAQETMFKYGTMIPRNDAEASRSPEAVRWMSGKQLEWLRLKMANTFETKWDWN